MRRLLSTFLIISACSQKIEGPSPTATGLTPSLVCGEQITTNVQIAGSGLSPLAVDAATDDPKLAIPDIALLRVKDVTGAAVSGEAPVLVPNDPKNPAMALVKWTSQTSM